MAEGFEPYHVPQQSRRDKLRVLAAQTTATHPGGCVVEPQPPAANLHGCAGLLALYDPTSLISSSSDLLACASAGESCKVNPGGGCIVKEEGSNLMGFVHTGGSSSNNSSSSNFRNPYLDPQLSLPLNPNSIQDIHSHPFLYTPQSLQDFDHRGYNAGGGAHDQVVVFKPEPLSLSLSSHPANSGNVNIPLELNLQRFGPAIYNSQGIVGSGSNGGTVGSRSSVPPGPFTGYASILKGSRFLKPAQQLLEEFCDLGGRGVYAEKLAADSSLMDPPLETLCAGGIADDAHDDDDDDPVTVAADGGECRRKKSRLISMLDEVCFSNLLFFFFLFNKYGHI